MDEQEIRASERKKLLAEFAKLWRNRYSDKSLRYSEVYDFFKKQGGDPRKLGSEP